MKEDIIRELCINKKIKWPAHAAARIQERGISRLDILHCLQDGEIIENYPNDFPHPSCLVYGCSLKNAVIHVVVGCDEEWLYIVTAYFPDTVRFCDDLKTRKER